MKLNGKRRKVWWLLVVVEMCIRDSDNAVRGHHDRTWEAGKLYLLILTAAAVVTDQMFEFTQFRICLLYTSRCV